MSGPLSSRALGGGRAKWLEGSYAHVEAILTGWLERKLVPWITSLGITNRTVTLEVLGRTSGKPRKVTVATVTDSGSRYLVSVHGVSNWVRNVRAANGAAELLSGGRQPVKLIEVPVEDRPRVLQLYVSQGSFGRSAEDIAAQFGVKPDATIEQVYSIASDHPVFKIEETEVAAT